MSDVDISSPPRQPWLNAAASPRWEAVGVAALGTLTLFLALRQLANDALGYPDADRILMDGVFFRDFFVDMPLTGIYDYTAHYFAQYPALSIGYRPPFFPFVEGLFNSVLGIEIWASRLALLSFLAVGLAAFYALSRHRFGPVTALIATGLLVTTPFYIQYSWYTMAEIPVVAMALATAWSYARYVERERNLDLIATCLFALLAIYTKQTAVFLFLWMVLHQIGSGTILRQLRTRRSWVAIIATILLVAPLAAITLWLGDQNIAQSVGTGERAGLSSRADWDFLLRRLHQLYQAHLTSPVLALAAIGLVWGLIRRDTRLWFWLSYVLAVFLFFTYVLGSNNRYPIFWIPAFALFAALPASYIVHHGRWRHGVIAIGVATILWQAGQVYAMRPKFATGYDLAAQYVVAESESPTVFFDGYNNGYFTYFVRRADEARDMYVLRGDKLLTSSSIASRNWLEVHAKSKDDIAEIIDRFGVQFIVVESRNTIRLPIHQELRDLLRADARYVLRRRIPVDTGTPSTRRPLKNLDLLIYERIDRPAAAGGILRLRLPVVGQTLEIPMHRIPDRERPR